MEITKAISQLESDVQRINSKIAQERQQLDIDFLHSFRWGSAEDLYKLMYQKKYLEYVRTVYLDCNDDEFNVWINGQIQELTSKLLKAKLRSSTNSQVVADMLEFEATKSLLDRLTIYFTNPTV